jgi:hypothetical protein
VRIALATVAAWLLAWAGAARAQPALPSCQTFARGSADTPAIVADWLARSSDDHVVVCAAAAGEGGAPQAPPAYTGESTVVKHGPLCSYSSHGLSRAGSGGASRLERYERGDAVGMTLAGGDCPAPHAADSAPRYTLTYDVTPTAYESITTFWSAVASSAEALDRATDCCGARGGTGAAAPGSALVAETRARLRVTVAAGRMRSAAVTRIVRTSGRGMRHRYALFVTDPDSRPGAPSVYVIYLSKWPFGPYHIIAITTAAG